MGIANSQLETWSNPGPQSTAKETHESIRSALENGNVDIPSNKSLNVFLQGSYKNNTNIHGDSDVDIVAKLKGIWGYDLSLLSESEKALYDDSYTSANYSWDEFHQDIVDALQSYYRNEAVEIGNKCIKVEGYSGRLDADIVPCFSYRRYFGFEEEENERYAEGIKFYSQNTNRMIVNYPTIHWENGTEKNQTVNENYKPAIRMFKNARNKIIEDGYIEENTAPSYFIECLLWNIKNEHYEGSLDEIFLSVLNRAVEKINNGEDLVVQHEQRYLFGDQNEQWSLDKAVNFLNGLVEFWDNS